VAYLIINNFYHRIKEMPFYIRSMCQSCLLAIILNCKMKYLKILVTFLNL